MKKSALYRLEIAPLVVLPLARSPFFSYLSGTPLVSGAYVTIPFGKRILEGVVFDCAPLPGSAPQWMKYVGETLKPEFLTPEQLQLAEYISDEYFTPLGRTLNHFLPHRVQSRKKKDNFFVKSKVAPRPTKEEEKILKNFTSLPYHTPGFLDTCALNNARRVFVLLAKKTVTAKKQVLFLVPEITLLPEWESVFLPYFSRETIVVLSSQISDGAYFEAWEKIRSGEARIVLATRQGLFAPFKNLGLVTLLEEQDESYKQWDMSPRYEGKRIARELARLHRAKLLFVSGTPSIESHYRLLKKHYVPLVPLKKITALGPLLEIVNLRLERYRKNYSPLSQALVDGIRKVLNEKKQVLLYIHRRGMNAFSVCEHCKNIIRCPHSGHVLTSNKDGTFRCLSCNYKTSAFPSCPSCGHLGFRHIGFGTERVEREIRKLFPSARVFRADGSTMRASGSAEYLYTQVSQGSIDILIGTQMILKGPTLPKLALFGMIDADSLLAFPDFRADEKFSQSIIRATQEMNGGKVFIQTFHPESAFLRKIASLDSGTLVAQLLAEREDLYYPPFARLLAITCQGKTKEEAEESAKTMRQSLTALLPQEQRVYRLNAPRPAKKQGMKKVFESAFLLRMPVDQSLPPAVRSLLRHNASHCVIDVDPLSFI